VKVNDATHIHGRTCRLNRLPPVWWGWVPRWPRTHQQPDRQGIPVSTSGGVHQAAIKRIRKTPAPYWLAFVDIW
jgi:hypothetical protein